MRWYRARASASVSSATRRSVTSWPTPTMRHGVLSASFRIVATAVRQRTSPLGRTMRNSVSYLPPSADRPREAGEELVAVGRVHELDHHVAAAVELARRQPVDRLELRRHLPPVRSQVPLERAHAGGGQRQPELLLAGPRQPAAAGKAGQPAAHAGAHAEV